MLSVRLDVLVRLERLGRLERVVDLGCSKAENVLSDIHVSLVNIHTSSGSETNRTRLSRIGELFDFVKHGEQAYHLNLFKVALHLSCA